MRRYSYPECGEGIGRDLEGALVYPVEEPPEDTVATLRPLPIDRSDSLLAGSRLLAVVVEDDGGGGLVLQNLP